MSNLYIAKISLYGKKISNLYKISLTNNGIPDLKEEKQSKYEEFDLYAYNNNSNICTLHELLDYIHSLEKLDFVKTYNKSKHQYIIDDIVCFIKMLNHKFNNNENMVVFDHNYYQESLEYNE